MGGRINILGLDQAEVVAALYNHSRPLGMGWLQHEDKPMTAEEARAEMFRLRELGVRSFDYLKGRVMKVELVQPIEEFDTALYDRDNGEGAAARAVKSLMEG